MTSTIQQGLSGHQQPISGHQQPISGRATTTQTSGHATTSVAGQVGTDVALSTPPSLLIVEGDQDIAGLTAQVLIDAGYIVTHAASPHDALALFAVRRPRAYRLVLSDTFQCDRARAYAWLDQLRTVTTVPIVIWSAAPSVFYADYESRGYAGFLPKPFELRDLLSLMTDLVPLLKRGP